MLGANSFARSSASCGLNGEGGGESAKFIGCRLLGDGAVTGCNAAISSLSHASEEGAVTPALPSASLGTPAVTCTASSTGVSTRGGAITGGVTFRIGGGGAGGAGRLGGPGGADRTLGAGATASTVDCTLQAVDCCELDATLVGASRPLHIPAASKKLPAADGGGCWCMLCWEL